MGPQERSDLIASATLMEKLEAQIITLAHALYDRTLPALAPRTYSVLIGSKEEDDHPPRYQARLITYTNPQSGLWDFVMPEEVNVCDEPEEAMRDLLEDLYDEVGRGWRWGG
ncbi:hypothetical protein NX059_006669 [Plenodomus lindquistii]|nr:hypothetical protein NX059_006669 [Plenodomus lindquistii]